MPWHKVGARKLGQLVYSHKRKQAQGDGPGCFHCGAAWYCGLLCWLRCCDIQSALCTRQELLHSHKQ